MRKIIDWALPFVAALGLVGMALANPDPLAREALCSRLGVCFYSKHPEFWNGLFYDLGLGAVVSIVFYWLLVKLPDYSKRRRIRRYLTSSYKAVRRDMTFNFLSAFNNAAVSYELIYEIITQNKFKEYFNEPSERVDGDRWDDVANNISRVEIQEIAHCLNVLKSDIEYLLNSVEHFDNETFDILQNTSKAISVTDFQSEDHDNRKRLLGFLWQIMAGWNPITGYVDKDPIQSAIDRV
nr:hypothetical protein [Ochrobactrum sp. UNC390CL2Tsu3S39]